MVAYLMNWFGQKIYKSLISLVGWTLSRAIQRFSFFMYGLFVFFLMNFPDRGKDQSGIHIPYQPCEG